MEEILIQKYIELIGEKIDEILSHFDPNIGNKILYTSEFSSTLEQVKVENLKLDYLLKILNRSE